MKYVKVRIMSMVSLTLVNLEDIVIKYENNIEKLFSKYFV